MSEFVIQWYLEIQTDVLDSKPDILLSAIVSAKDLLSAGKMAEHAIPAVHSMVPNSCEFEHEDIQVEVTPLEEYLHNFRKTWEQVQKEIDDA
jgi:hypothetical protein